jgi:hypothetical protein
MSEAKGIVQVAAPALIALVVGGPLIEQQRDPKEPLAERPLVERREDLVSPDHAEVDVFVSVVIEPPPGRTVHASVHESVNAVDEASATVTHAVSVQESANALDAAVATVTPAAA